MITALSLSLAAGLAAGVYLIKSARPVVEIQSPASTTQDVAHEAAADAETTNPQPTQVASESRPEASPTAEINLDAAAPAVDAEDAEVKAEKTNRDLPAPKRSTADEASSGRAERTPEPSPSKAAVAERTPERAARKAPPSKTNTPAPPEAVRTRRATTVAERPPVQRAPERSLPVSSPPPSSAKSKRVIQWP
jgi:electron transport complex protein RnfC